MNTLGVLLLIQFVLMCLGAPATDGQRRMNHIALARGRKAGPLFIAQIDKIDDEKLTTEMERSKMEEFNLRSYGQDLEEDREKITGISVDDGSKITNERGHSINQDEEWRPVKVEIKRLLEEIVQLTENRNNIRGVVFDERLEELEENAIAQAKWMLDEHILLDKKDGSMAKVEQLLQAERELGNEKEIFPAEKTLVDEDKKETESQYSPDKERNILDIPVSEKVHQKEPEEKPLHLELDAIDNLIFKREKYLKDFQKQLDKATDDNEKVNLKRKLENQKEKLMDLAERFNYVKK